MPTTPKPEGLGVGAAELATLYEISLEEVVTEAYRALEWLQLTGAESDGYTIVIVDGKAYLDSRLVHEVQLRLSRQKLVRDKQKERDA